MELFKYGLLMLSMAAIIAIVSGGTLGGLAFILDNY